MVRFYIVRHGQTLLNSLDRAQVDFDKAYTSDMLRATTAGKY